MKIAIEAGSFYGNRSGVGRYALTLTRELIASRPDDEFVIFSFLRIGKAPNRDFTLPSNARYRYIRWFPGRLFSLCMRLGISLPMELFGIIGYDAIIFPNFICWPSLLRQKRICVIHDLAFVHYPEYIQAKNLKMLQRQTIKSIHRASHVIAVSECTKKDIEATYLVPPEKISIVPNGVDLAVFSPQKKDEIERVRKKYELPSNYILFVGTVEPRKNIAGMIEAYAKSYARHKNALVLAGGKGWNDTAIQNALSSQKDLPIYLPGFVDDEDLPGLYSGASLFIFPSIYEGFGIPVLEAMACGCPVVCGNNSSFPELVGDAAITVDVTDSQAIANAIREVLENKTVKKSMRSKGIKRAANYSWISAAKDMNFVLSNYILRD